MRRLLDGLRDPFATSPTRLAAARAAFDDAPWRGPAAAAAFAAAAPVATMLSEDEQRLYCWLTACWSRGRGRIVDLGCFAGGSTARLAAGRAQAGHGTPIQAYDFFTADEGAKANILYAQGVPAFEGNDIYPLARRNLAPWSQLVTLHRGDIFKQEVQRGPLEILINDASKSPRAVDATAQRFYRDLMPGKSVLVQQDFQEWNHPWIACQMELLAEYFAPVAICTVGTIAYLTLRRPSKAALRAARINRLDDAAMIALLEQAKARYAGTAVAPRMARAIRGLRANPGVRLPWRYAVPFD